MITKGLLNAILDTEVKEIKLDENTVLNAEDMRNDKVGILDIKATLDNKITCNIEMQMVNQDDLAKRMMFYWSKMYIANIHKGEDYGVLKKSIGILLANFKLKNLAKIPKGHTEWKLREKDFSKIVLTDVCEIHIIELPKLKELKEKGELSKWIKFLLAPEKLEVREMKSDEAIKKAKEQYEILKQDEKERYLAELRMKHILDTNNIKKTGYRIGREEGREVGRKEGEKKAKKEIAKEMIKNKIDLATIQKCTGLTKEEIEKLS